MHRSVLVFLLVAAVLSGETLAQLTFSSDWGKRSVEPEPLSCSALHARKMEQIHGMMAREYSRFARCQDMEDAATGGEILGEDKMSKKH